MISNLPARRERALVRNEVRTILASYQGKHETIYRTQFFIDRLDLTTAILPFLRTAKDPAVFAELLEAIQDEFEDFIILETPDATIDPGDNRVISCEACARSYTQTLETSCPNCGHVSVFQIAELDLSAMMSKIEVFHADDPIIRNVLLGMELHVAQSYCVRLITIYETFWRALNDHLGGPKLSRPNLFQNVADGQQWFVDHYGFDPLDVISAKDVRDFKLFALKRNVFGHQSSGLADQRYITRIRELVADSEGIEQELNKPVKISIKEVETNVKRVQLIVARARQYFLPELTRSLS